MCRLWRCVGSRRQWQFVGLAILTLASAAAEVFSIGAALPFLGVLAAPERVLAYPGVANVARLLGIASASDLILPLASIFAASALLAGGARLALVWSVNRVALICGADLSVDAYRRALYLPYQTHISRNSSQVIAALNNKMSQVVLGAMLPSLQMVSAMVLVIAITLVLFAMNPIVAASVSVFLATAYAITTRLFRARLRYISEVVAKEQTQVLKALQEGLGGIRDVLVDGTQEYYRKIYQQSIHPLRRAEGDIAFIGQSPRFVMEAIGLIVFAVLAYALSQRTEGITTALPILGALVLGAQRLLPALQQAHSAWTAIAGVRVSLQEVLELLEQPLPPEAFEPVPPRLAFAREIRFKSVDFRYGSDDPWVLKNFDLSIKKGARVGFVGRTGSGKSTAIDMLMGLLIPTRGQLLVDGICIDRERCRSWRQIVAHVPQVIYLADTTLAENIAFGVDRDEIDFQRVSQAASRAQIADFIRTLPAGYETVVGERGIRLSGGQRQRIGIARALYKRASVLVFDEATSALDNKTEQAVLTSIDALDRELTVLVIAHRLTTVRHCNPIVELENGRIVAMGTYEELLERSPSFRQLAKLDHHE